MTTPTTLAGIVEALDDVDFTQLTHEPAQPRTVIQLPNRTAFEAACTALDLEPRESPSTVLGRREFYATAGPLNSTPLLLTAASLSSDADWEDPA
ncbi:hypothetical protein HMPREF0063_11929 [Aeromicrobium marinum DSM 15272]|uniref:Uncharacterized protein n=1 Tax=Aeromicrobium marinum DSM 15272 TaxID=585531 RepID=E2SDZ3_9ACTN|nr:hypothetical protein [Aeromicrobium marinum]EFQ82720.1 hypothetical protein HMPREF0063_11929 [Aeromicrobium marinum DSM 15272]